jgi:hypothetical protein
MYSLPCIFRNEEYTCYVDQSIVKDLFHKSKHYTSSAKIQSLYVIRSIIERMTIEHIPRSQALEMSMHLKSSYPNTDVPETPDQREQELLAGQKGRNNGNIINKLDAVVESETKAKAQQAEPVMTSLLRESFNESVFLAKTLNNEEEDLLRVLTIRSVETKGNLNDTHLLMLVCCSSCHFARKIIVDSFLLMFCFCSDILVCSIAKVKTTNWEDLLSALPLAHRVERGQQSQTKSSTDAVVPTAPSTSRNTADKQSFRKRSTRYTNEK